MLVGCHSVLFVCYLGFVCVTVLLCHCVLFMCVTVLVVGVCDCVGVLLRYGGCVFMSVTVLVVSSCL